MSWKLFNFATAFVKGEMSADRFADTYQEMWRQERDSEISSFDEDSLSEACSTTFLLADLYDPYDDREEYELTEAQLRQKVAEVLATVRR